MSLTCLPDMTTAALPANHLWTPPADPADDAVALLETYSGIPRARVSAHVRALRDQALAVFPLPLHRPLPLPLPLPRPAAGPAARVPGAVDVVHASKLSPLFAWGDQVRLGCRLVHSFKPGLQDAMLLGQESGREAGDATGPSRDDVDDHERVKVNSGGGVPPRCREPAEAVDEIGLRTAVVRHVSRGDGAPWHSLGGDEGERADQPINRS